MRDPFSPIHQRPLPISVTRILHPRQGRGAPQMGRCWGRKGCFPVSSPQATNWCGALPLSWPGVLGGDEASVSQCWESFACSAHGPWCFLRPAREMSHSGRGYTIASYMVMQFRDERKCWEAPAMAFVIEVSWMASAASLSCLPLPYPPTVAAAVKWGDQPEELGQRVAPCPVAGSPRTRGSLCCLWACLPGMVPAPVMLAGAGPARCWGPAG